MQVKYSGISDEALLAKVSEAYGNCAERLEFIPMGDSAYAYTVECAGGELYFLKLFDLDNERQRRSAARLGQYLPLTWNLYHQGLFRNLAEPIQGKNEELKTEGDRFTIVLFRYIEGETLADAYPFSDEVLEKVARSMAAIHNIPRRYSVTEVESERFELSFEQELRDGMAAIEASGQDSRDDISVIDDNPVLQSHIYKLRDLILPRKADIAALMDDLHRLQVDARAEGKEMVLCHADVWGGNLIRDAHGELIYLDWENAILAPPERDLFIFAGPQFGTFLKHYVSAIACSFVPDPNLLRYFTNRHHLSNLTNWIRNILYRNNNEEQTLNDLEMIEHHCLGRFSLP